MPSPGKAVRHAFLFLVDGMRPDGLITAKTPFLDQVLLRGAYAYHAKTVMPSTTLPCHTSLFFSVPPDIHGILDNVWKSFQKPIPSLFDIIHEQGMPVVSFFNWEPLRDLSRPGSLAGSFFLRDNPGDNGQCDRELTSMALSWLSSHEWVFSFLYLHNTDKTGHSSGWMSDSYFDAIANADRCIENICSILPEDTLIIVTSDHGGHDHTHHSDLAEDMTVPLILQGPGIPRCFEIKDPVSIIDIAPTIVRFLDVGKPEGWQGKEIIL